MTLRPLALSLILARLPHLREELIRSRFCGRPARAAALLRLASGLQRGRWTLRTRSAQEVVDDGMQRDGGVTGEARRKGAGAQPAQQTDDTRDVRVQKLSAEQSGHSRFVITARMLKHGGQQVLHLGGRCPLIGSALFHEHSRVLDDPPASEGASKSREQSLAPLVTRLAPHAVRCRHRKDG